METWRHRGWSFTPTSICAAALWISLRGSLNIRRSSFISLCFHVLLIVTWEHLLTLSFLLSTIFLPSSFVFLTYPPPQPPPLFPWCLKHLNVLINRACLKRTAFIGMTKPACVCVAVCICLCEQGSVVYKQHGARTDVILNSGQAELSAWKQNHTISVTNRRKVSLSVFVWTHKGWIVSECPENTNTGTPVLSH